jgi:hypothetical protein
MDRHVTPSEPEHILVTFLPADTMFPSGEARTGARGFRAEAAACHFATVNSGVELRALLASFLL